MMLIHSIHSFTTLHTLSIYGGTRELLQALMLLYFDEIVTLRYFNSSYAA
jgi:hypothetical protein